MGGADKRQRALLVVINPAQRIPQGHPLRRIKALAAAARKELSPVFDKMYRAVGRPSIPAERRLKASLLMARYTVRRERLFCEQLDYNFLFRWFLDLEADEASFDPSTFSRHRARLLEHAVADEFFRAVLAQARGLNLLSDEHFTGDGTLGEARAALKSFQRKHAGPREPPADPGNPPVNFHGERRRTATQQSTNFYAQLRARGKYPKSALTACTRKLLVILNAMLHNNTHWHTTALAFSNSALYPPGGAVSEHSCLYVADTVRQNSHLGLAAAE
jgi:transposase